MVMLILQYRLKMKVRIKVLLLCYVFVKYVVMFASCILRLDLYADYSATERTGY